MDLKVPSQPEERPPAPQRSSPLHLRARALLSEFRRFYYGFTRENVTGFLKTLVWAIPITVFIWVYAESEEQEPDAGQLINIQVSSSDPNKVATLDRNSSVIICDLVGPQANVDRFKQSLSTGAPIPIELDTDKVIGQKSFPLLDNLRESPQFKEAGIEVVKCDPVLLTVTVDALVRNRPIPVRPPPNVPGLQSVTFDPPTVNVTGPKGFIDGLTQVTADISSLKELNVPGPHVVDGVPLKVDSSEPVTYDRLQVRATLTVAEKDVVGHYRAPIWLALQPDVQKRYSITANGDFTPTFDVIGPAEEIDKLEHGQITPLPHALLEISDENVNNVNPVELKIEGLPPGVRLAGPPPEVSFTAAPR
ncbi:MAG: hypothetical protein ABSH08_17075 [Tepidisphaeraceae bacterium]|jgi:hypothetical protein